MDKEAPLDEKLFTETDYKIYGFLCKQGFATAKEVSKELKIPISSVQALIGKLCKANWLKQDGSSRKYHINLLKILNNSTNTLLKEYQNIRKKEEDLVLNTSTSLTEATTATNNHLTNSMENLFNESDTLGGNLVEETISQISEFENNRLRAFGSYRINLDSFMRGVKEDIFRDLRKNLGFTSAGEIIFKEASLDMPEMPSALYIADTINNSRKLIKRGFSDIESKTKQVFEKKRERFQINQNELISSLEKDMNLIQNEKKEIFSSKTELVLSLVKRYQNQFEILYSSNLVSIENAKNSLIDNFDQKKVLFKNELEQITNRLIIKTKSTISDVLKRFTAFPELIKKDLESIKQEKSQKKIQKLGNILRKSNLGFVQDSKEIVQQIQVLLNSNEEFSQKQGNIITDIIKQKTTINDLVEERNHGELRTGIENLNNFLENLENGYSLFSSHGIDTKKRLESYIKRLEERLIKLENQESSIETTLATAYDLQMSTVFQNVQLSLGNLLQNISNELLLINDGFEREIENQNQLILEEIENSFETILNNITKNIQNQKLTFENGANRINNEFNKASSEIEIDLTKVMEENNQFLDAGFTILKEHTFNVTNIYEINHADLTSDLKQLFENMSISFTGLVNSLESKLGYEYRNLLEYFEKTKETTMGTAKNLLEDLTNLLTNQIDKIWTNALKELNTLQEKTQTTKIHHTLKNKLMETNVKIKNAVQNQIKGVGIALEMLENSIKMSFDDLYSQMRESSDSFSRKTEEIK